MTYLTRFGKAVVAAAALAATTSATFAQGAADAATVTSRVVTLLITNNTTTPAIEPDHPEGFLRIRCNQEAVSDVLKGGTPTLDCAEAVDGSVNFWYEARLKDDQNGTRRFHSATVAIECNDQAKVKLSGSGTSITAQVNCVAGGGGAAAVD